MSQPYPVMRLFITILSLTISWVTLNAQHYRYNLGENYTDIQSISESLLIKDTEGHIIGTDKAKVHQHRENVRESIAKASESGNIKEEYRLRGVLSILEESLGNINDLRENLNIRLDLADSLGIARTSAAVSKDWETMAMTYVGKSDLYVNYYFVPIKGKDFFTLRFPRLYIESSRLLKVDFVSELIEIAEAEQEGNPSKAMEIYELILNDFHRVRFLKHAIYFKTLDRASGMYYEKGELEEGFNFEDKYIRHYKTSIGVDDELVFHLIKYGERQNQNFRFDRSENTFKEALSAMKEVMPDSHWNRNVITSLATAYIFFGERNKALNMLEENCEDIQKILVTNNKDDNWATDVLDYAVTTYTMMKVYNDTGEYGKAIDRGNKSMEIIYELLQTPNLFVDFYVGLRAIMPFIFRAMGEAYGGLGDYDPAIEFFENSLELFESSEDRVYALILLSKCYESKGDYLKCFENRQKAEEEFQKLPQTVQAKRAQLVKHIDDEIYMAQNRMFYPGQEDEVLEYAIKQLTGRLVEIGSDYDNDPKLRSYILRNLGQIYLTQKGDFVKSHQYFQQAFNIDESADNQHSLMVSNAINGYAPDKVIPYFILWEKNEIRRKVMASSETLREGMSFSFMPCLIFSNINNYSKDNYSYLYDYMLFHKGVDNHADIPHILI